MRPCRDHRNIVGARNVRDKHRRAWNLVTAALSTALSSGIDLHLVCNALVLAVARVVAKVSCDGVLLLDPISATVMLVVLIHWVASWAASGFSAVVYLANVSVVASAALRWPCNIGPATG